MSKAAFAPCVDDDDGRYMAFASSGHLERSLPVLRSLWRALRYETGYTGPEMRDTLKNVTFSHGYVGRHPSSVDLLVCEADGVAWSYDDDGEPLQCTDVEPTTWAHIKVAS